MWFKIMEHCHKDYGNASDFLKYVIWDRASLTSALQQG